jgi:hypothetical protein
VKWKNLRSGKVEKSVLSAAAYFETYLSTFLLFNFSTCWLRPRTGRSEPDPDTGRRAVDTVPDGEHVIGLTNVGTDAIAAGSQILVVLNWFDELKARVPAR